ncbi:MAG: zinc-ribbon domain-containing protein [Lachnospiraceae bacterium]
MKCGAPLPEGVSFCMHCGASLTNNARINVSNGADNLLKRAEQFEERGDFDTAFEYYNKVLDIDINEKRAQDGIARIENYVYYRIDAYGHSNYGELLLIKRKLIFWDFDGKVTVYYLERIKTLRVVPGLIEDEAGFGFMYIGEESEITYTCKRPKEIIEVITNAINGIYPEIRVMSQKEKDLDNYILAKFDKNRKVEAIKYYIEKTGAGLKEAKEYIEELLYHRRWQ